jgi:hypothetical protein
MGCLVFAVQGHGIANYSNGDVYDGEWQGGVRQGHGERTSTDGSKYGMHVVTVH